MKIQEIMLEKMISHLISLAKKELKLDELPEIHLVDEPVIQGMSFGEFDGSIKVVYKNRHPMDVMRTLAHELVHWKQRTLNMEMDGGDGSETENQANAIAGVIMRKFGQMYPDYFINSLT